MKQYEYNVITNDTPLQERVLNKLGMEGWSLSSHTYSHFPHTPDRHVYTFKREKVENEEEPGWNNPLVDFLDWEENYKKESEWQRRKRLEVMREAKQKEESYTRSLKELAKQKEERELIEKILDDRSNANGHDEEGNPRYIYDGYEYILNTSCNKILSMSFERKFKLDDSFKKRLEEIVVEDVPASSWMDEYRREYDAVLTSGMFFEWFPTFTGVWDRDKYAFCHDRKYKKLSTQDPAVYNKRDNTTIEDQMNLYREMNDKEIERMNIEEYDRALNTILDEGFYDEQYK